MEKSRKKEREYNTSNCYGGVTTDDIGTYIDLARAELWRQDNYRGSFLEEVIIQF